MSELERVKREVSDQGVKTADEVYLARDCVIYVLRDVLRVGVYLARRSDNTIHSQTQAWIHYSEQEGFINMVVDMYRRYCERISENVWRVFSNG